MPTISMFYGIVICLYYFEVKNWDTHKKNWDTHYSKLPLSKA